MEHIISPASHEVAFGGPGVNPSWQHGDKDGIGTAYSSSSRLWFTIWNGIVTEIYAPTVDRPQVRDLQLLFFQDDTFVLPETEMETTIERLDESLGYLVRGRSKRARRSLLRKKFSAILTTPACCCT